VDLISTMTVGRDSDNDIVLAEITVSRCHALLLMQQGQVALVDLDSTNGSFVNGVQARPDEAWRLEDGDAIRLGQVVMRYHRHTSAMPARSAPPVPLFAPGFYASGA